MNYGRALKSIIDKLGRRWINYHKRRRSLYEITPGEKIRWLNALNFLITVLGLSLKLLLTRHTGLMSILALCVAVLAYNNGML